MRLNIIQHASQLTLNVLKNIIFVSVCLYFDNPFEACALILRHIGVNKVIGTTIQSRLSALLYKTLLSLGAVVGATPDQTPHSRHISTRKFAESSDRIVSAFAWGDSSVVLSLLSRKLRATSFSNLSMMESGCSSLVGCATAKWVHNLDSA